MRRRHADRAPRMPHPIPYWHTAVLLLVLVLLERGATPRAATALTPATRTCASTLPPWSTSGFSPHTSGGDCAAPEATLRELIGGRWQSVEDFLLDIAIAAGVWFGALMVIAMAALAMGMNHTGNIDDARKQIGFLAPQSTLEIVLWICLSATAGFCEEVLFRGYLQKQFTRLLRNRWIALVVVSILFGLGHGYEGAQRMVLIALLGFAFGTHEPAAQESAPGDDGAHSAGHNLRIAAASLR